MSNLPSHILNDFADQARGLLARVESDLAEIRRAPGQAPAIEAAGRATGALRSIRTGAAFLELSALASAAERAEQQLAALQSSAGTLDQSVLDMLRAAVESITFCTGLPAAVPEAQAISEPAPQIRFSHDGAPVAAPIAPLRFTSEPTREPLRIAERKAPLLHELIKDLTAAHERIEAAIHSDGESAAILAEGRDLRRLGRFFALEALEALGAAVECAGAALASPDASSRQALPRLLAILNTLAEFTTALSDSTVIQRNLTGTCAALQRIADGNSYAVPNLYATTPWLEALAADAAGQPVVAPAQFSDGSGVPDVDPVASIAAQRVESSLSAPSSNNLYSAPDAVLHPLANVLTESGRVAGMARSIPQENADPVATVRAVNRVTDDLTRAALGMKGAVLASRARSLHLLLSDCATLVANIAGQRARDIRPEVHGGRLEIDDAVLARLRDPLLAIVHRIAVDAAQTSTPGSDPIVLFLSAEAEDSHVLIRITSPAAPVACSGDDLGSARDAIEALAGSVEFTSDPSEGSAVVLRVPTNLAFMDALVVQIGDSTCALPTAQVEEVVMPGASQITSIGARRAIQLRSATVPLLDGRDVLGAASSSFPARHVIVVRSRDRRVALSVDRALGRQEIVIRPLDRALAVAASIRSAASIADGSPALVIDVPAFVRSASAIRPSAAA